MPGVITLIRKITRRGESTMRTCQEIPLGVDSFGGGHAQVEHEQSHGYGEDAVAKGGETFHASVRQRDC